MEKLSVKLVGQSPLMTHNNRLANPLGPYAKALKLRTGKRNKTDTDLIEIGRIEWEGGLYLESGAIVMPGRCLNACFFEGAKKKKNGPRWRSGAMLDQEYYPMKYQGPRIKVEMNGEIPNQELDKYYENYVDQRMVRVGNNQVLRTRPYFTNWSIETTILYDETIVDRRTLMQICEDAGYLIGLCEFRPGSKGGGSMGRFVVEEI